MGCFKDDRWQRDLSGFTTNFPTMTGQACVDLCRTKGFRYAATQYGQHCFCGNEFGKYGKASNCDMKCGGNAAETCGGNAANSVYAVTASGQPTASPPAPTRSPPPATSPSPTRAEYLGCFKDDRWQRDLSGFTTNFPTMTGQACVDLCRTKGFRYAATQYGQHCFCGNEFGKYGKASNCDMKCGGSAAETCGGNAANSVYAVGGALPAGTNR